MKRLINYFLYSNLEIGLSLNPLRWGVMYFDIEKRNAFDPGLIIRINSRFGPLKLHFWIDDGSW